MTHVSVILPTYNRKEEALECVASILDQTFREFELLVVDDGSTDGTAASFVERYGEAAVDRDAAASFAARPVPKQPLDFCVNGTRVRYVYQKNMGFSTACNRGLALSRGAYVAIAEPDVRWLPDRLEKQIQVIRRTPGVLVLLGGAIPVRNGQPGKKVRLPGPGGWLFEQIIRDEVPPYTAALFHRRCLEVINGFDENLPNCADYDLWVRITAKFPIHTLAEPVLYLPARSLDSRGGWASHRFRVYALEKAFQTGYLNPEYRRMVAEQIVEKCRILVEGYQKKNSLERANFYERKRRRFASEVRKLQATRIQALEANLATAGRRLS
jgi:glycosyltransferase involved in cell wall biosynthesis